MAINIGVRTARDPKKRTTQCKADGNPKNWADHF